MKIIYEKENKRIAVLNVKELLSIITIPDFQRPENTEHSSLIFEKMKIMYNETNSLSYVGQISLGVIKGNISNSYLLDGQHRVSAISKLADTFPYIQNEEIDICMYECHSEGELYDIYAKLNTSKKVELYVGHSHTIIYQMIKKYMNDQYKSFISKSDRPRVPNVNPERIVSEMEKRNLLEKLNISSAKTMIQYIEEMNSYYKHQGLHKYESWGCKNYQKITDWMDVSKPFYLGLFSHYEWMDRLYKHVAEGISYEDMSHQFHQADVSTRKISKLVRKHVWGKHFDGSIMGECICCKRDISFDSFECGHIIPKCMGGEDKVSNLEPLCGVCNKDMGTMNLHEFIRSVKQSLD